MVSETSGEGEGPSPDAVDRLIRRLDAHRSLPAKGASNIPAFGPPVPVADEARLAREPTEDLVVTPAWIYITLELPGASRETLEVTTSRDRLTVHVRDASGHVFHREVDLPQPVEPGAATATYRNGVLDVTLRRIRAHRIRVRKGV